MKTVTIRFTAQCPECKSVRNQEFKGMGKSHKEWITGLGNAMPDYYCNVCKRTVTAHLMNVEVIE